MKRDYYEVLGLGRDADLQQVKKAYRALARQLHPDVNDHDPDAETKFKEATEAYEVLCDAEKRRVYDAYGHDGLRGGGGGQWGGGFTDLSDIFQSFFGGDIFGEGRTARRSAVRGDDLGVVVELDLQEAAFGVSREVEVDLLDTCGECGGSGSKDPDSIHACPDCGGSGQVRTVRRTALGQFVQSGPCSRCRGEGRIIDEPCPVCAGRGRARRVKTVSVDIPAGIAHEQRIRLSGQGGAGARGGPPGDLYVQVAVHPHEEFIRQGDDIIYDLYLTMVQAALGAKITVPTLDGEEVVEVAPGTQPGEVKVLRGRGVPRLQRSGRGDQKVVLNVMIPRDLTPEQKDLLRELDSCCGDDHYARKHEGVLHRLKTFFGG
ncbi:MAG: molecular chaperone DnaJ [Thermoleophilia bacterium]